MTQTTTTPAITKQPIINGSFNHNLTDEEMLSFPVDTKKSMCWNLIVGMQFAHSFNCDPAIFRKVPQTITHDMITPETVDELLKEAREQFTQRQAQLTQLTNDHHFRIGEEIAEAQQRLGFSGFLQMPIGKLAGYLCKLGSWNDFEWPTVTDGLRKLESIAPRVYYGENNPNTGRLMHKWETSGEYIVMAFKYLSKVDQDRVLSFYRQYFEPTASTIKADSVRYELIDCGNDHADINLIYWWD